jgi:SAM-dependent methyltransferase
MKFETNYQYCDRETKAEYVWLKYKSILSGSSILDIGSDKCYLKKHIDDRTSYLGIDISGEPDQRVNLEKEKLPFPDNSFDCVLCLDVLEHLDNLHEVFDEVCRITSRYLIVSLPNPWSDFWVMIKQKEYKPGQTLVHYGLPLEKPLDRHKWFFSYDEAKSFLISNSVKNCMSIVQIDDEGRNDEGHGLVGWMKILARNILLRDDLDLGNLYTRTMWAVFEKDSPNLE